LNLNLSSLFSTKSRKGKQIKFVILFFERSGSSWLVDMLNSHPEISCLPEAFYLNWDKNAGKIGKPAYTKPEDIEQQLHRIYESPKAQSCGFKFKYPIQYNKYPDVVEFLNANKETIRMIFLYRKNRLKGAISSQNNLRLRKLNKTSNLVGKDTDLEPLKLDIKKAINYTEWRERSDFNFFNWAKEFTHLHIVTYENLLTDTFQSVADICSFLEVSSTYKPSSKIRKATPDSIRQAITNYDELQEQLRCHPLEKYLDF